MLRRREAPHRKTAGAQRRSIGQTQLQVVRDQEQMRPARVQRRVQAADVHSDAGAQRGPAQVQHHHDPARIACAQRTESD
eukprot:NODE_2383_length_431_cov_17.086387_g2302_i0.p2 GENE.NODE_2383_length_431_cov_17.086387_g2302_i0~~NODE_2383_length_431_cov_17.086387_g2302_i0.p2  ORF type:complete len:80 (-),score=12.60 NODE_2383_length_431_cov_17.086387_g2302_i0:192-431(-)